MYKSWYQSKTIWGGVIMLIATILQLTGVATISVGEQATLVDNVIAVVSVVAQLFGGLLTIYGRVRAEGDIKK